MQRAMSPLDMVGAKILFAGERNFQMTMAPGTVIDAGTMKLQAAWETLIFPQLDEISDATEQEYRNAIAIWNRLSGNPDVKDIFAFQYGDFTLENYQSHGRIAAPIAV